MDETTFETLAAATLQRIADAVEDAGKADVELQGGVLTIELDAGGTYLVNKHAPLKQLWVSSPVSGAGHYGWDEAAGAWVSTHGGGALAATLARELSETAGITVDLEGGS
jgi:frataxin